VNTHAEYRRHLHQPTAEAPPPPTAETAQHLAIHRDPSITSDQPGATTATGRRIAWVRPTELHASADGLIGRGIDLHAELARRARRGPRALTRSVQRTAPNLVRRGPATSVAGQEGVQL
jgi:hypothetical protein